MHSEDFSQTNLKQKLKPSFTPYFSSLWEPIAYITIILTYSVIQEISL